MDRAWKTKAFGFEMLIELSRHRILIALPALLPTTVDVATSSSNQKEFDESDGLLALGKSNHVGGVAGVDAEAIDDEPDDVEDLGEALEADDKDKQLTRRISGTFCGRQANVAEIYKAQEQVIKASFGHQAVSKTNV
jgi:hypothetical protein